MKLFELVMSMKKFDESKAKELINNGKVKIDGSTIYNPDYSVDELDDSIEFKNEGEFGITIENGKLVEYTKIGFTITCNKCGSADVSIEVYIIEGYGQSIVECNNPNCDNKKQHYEA